MQSEIKKQAYQKPILTNQGQLKDITAGFTRTTG